MVNIMNGDHYDDAEYHTYSGKLRGNKITDAKNKDIYFEIVHSDGAILGFWQIDNKWNKAYFYSRQSSRPESSRNDSSAIPRFLPALRGVYLPGNDAGSIHSDEMLVIMPYLAFPPIYKVFSAQKDTDTGSVNLSISRCSFSGKDMLSDENGDNKFRILYRAGRIFGVRRLPEKGNSDYFKTDLKQKYVDKYYYEEADRLDADSYKYMMRGIFANESEVKKVSGKE